MSEPSEQPVSNPTARERLRPHSIRVVLLDVAIQIAGEHAAAAVKGLESRIAELERERDEARGKYAFMVERAADTKLDGYRELASKLERAEARIAELERERDEARKCIAPLEESIDNARVAAQQRTARIAELEAALRGLAARYHRDAHEGDGIPEDAHEWDTAQRVLGKEAQT